MAIRQLKVLGLRVPSTDFPPMPPSRLPYNFTHAFSDKEKADKYVQKLLKAGRKVDTAISERNNHPEYLVNYDGTTRIES